jgi:hypothetical protein
MTYGFSSYVASSVAEFETTINLRYMAVPTRFFPVSSQCLLGPELFIKIKSEQKLSFAGRRKKEAVRTCEGCECIISRGVVKDDRILNDGRGIPFQQEERI